MNSFSFSGMRNELFRIIAFVLVISMIFCQCGLMKSYAANQTSYANPDIDLDHYLKAEIPSGETVAEFNASTDSSAKGSIVKNGDTYVVVLSGNGVVDVEDSVASLSEYLDKISALYIGNGITAIDSKALQGSTITEILFEENSSLKTIAQAAFKGCNKLTAVVLPASITCIYDNAFRNCKSVEKIYISEGLRDINCRVFGNCAKLTTIYLPSSIKTVGLGGFEDCDKIETVYHNCTEEHWTNYAYVDLSKSGNVYFKAADHVCNATVKASSIYSDVKKSKYKDVIDYLYINEYLTGTDAKLFGVSDKMTAGDLIEALYNKAGCDGIYEDAADWAVQSQVYSNDVNAELTVQRACDILLNTAFYNGFNPENVSDTIEWAAELGLISSTNDKDTVLTKEQMANILYNWCLCDYSTADRYDDIISTLKTAIAHGGDGMMYMVSLGLVLGANTNKSGDCTFILFPDGQTMLVDAGIGATDDQVVGFLESIGITSLDYLIMSHNHEDHVGGMMTVVKYINKAGGTIGNAWYVAASVSNITEILRYLEKMNVSPSAINIDTIEDWSNKDENVYITIGDVTLQLFGPNSEEVQAGIIPSSDDSGVNNSSIVIRLVYGESSILLCGDTYTNREQRLIEEYGDMLKADVVKCNHHGNYQANSALWVESVNPMIAVAEIDGNGNGGVEARYMENGTEFYCVGLDGYVMVSMDDQRNYEVTTQYDSILRYDVALGEHEYDEAVTVVSKAAVVVEEPAAEGNDNTVLYVAIAAVAVIAAVAGYFVSKKSKAKKESNIE